MLSKIKAGGRPLTLCFDQEATIKAQQEAPDPPEDPAKEKKALAHARRSACQRTLSAWFAIAMQSKAEKVIADRIQAEASQRSSSPSLPSLPSLPEEKKPETLPAAFRKPRILTAADGVGRCAAFDAPLAALLKRGIITAWRARKLEHERATLHRCPLHTLASACGRYPSMAQLLNFAVPTGLLSVGR